MKLRPIRRARREQDESGRPSLAGTASAAPTGDGVANPGGAADIGTPGQLAAAGTAHLDAEHDLPTGPADTGEGESGSGGTPSYGASGEEGLGASGTQGGRPEPGPQRG